MATSEADLWHQVHAQREDGVSAMFLIRDVEPRADQPQIFVIELPYTVTDISRLPDAAGYRRLDAFQQQWIDPACKALGWTFVAWKSEDGSFFLYLYGSGDPNALLEKLAPFDVALGFFNDRDADWSEYAALRELVDQAQAVPDDDEDDDDDGHDHAGSDANDHVHTEDCHHPYDPDATSDGIPVLDLTGDRSARKRAARAETVNLRAVTDDDSDDLVSPADASPEADEDDAEAEAALETATPAKRRAKASPAKRASPKSTPARPKAAAATKTPARKANAAAPKASVKRAGKQPAARPSPVARTAKPANKPATRKSAAVKPTARKPTARKPTARKLAARKPTAHKRPKPGNTRRY